MRQRINGYGINLNLHHVVFYSPRHFFLEEHGDPFIGRYNLPPSYLYCFYDDLDITALFIVLRILFLCTYMHAFHTRRQHLKYLEKPGSRKRKSYVTEIFICIFIET